VVEAGVEATEVELLLLLLLPHAARPTTTSAAAISTIEARLIRFTFLSSVAS
jgi:hypothetical protein